MEIKVEEQMVRVLRVEMTEAQARAVLVDATEFQNELRARLADAHAVTNAATLRLAQRRQSVPIRSNGHAHTKRGPYRQRIPAAAKGDGDPKAPRSVTSGSGTGKGLKGKWARKEPCPSCGKKLHRANSICPFNPYRKQDPASIPTPVAASTAS